MGRMRIHTGRTVFIFFGFVFDKAVCEVSLDKEGKVEEKNLVWNWIEVVCEKF
jgi:hypothetical protein